MNRSLLQGPWSPAAYGTGLAGADVPHHQEQHAHNSCGGVSAPSPRRCDEGGFALPSGVSPVVAVLSGGGSCHRPAAWSPGLGTQDTRELSRLSALLCLVSWFSEASVTGDGRALLCQVTVGTPLGPGPCPVPPRRVHAVM